MYRIIVMISMALMFAACGGGGSEADSGSSTTAAPPPPAAPKAITVEIFGDDQMKFNRGEIRVKVGQEVTVKLTHTGQLPKESMGHNWVLLKPGTNVQEWALAAMAATDSEYVPAGDAAVIANTGLVGGGESTEVTFTAPEAGTYDYICSFPGHYGVMKGKLIVE